MQKVLARAGLASRREVEQWIQAGRITVNGAPAVLGVQVTDADQVRLDGRLIRQRAAGPVQRVFLCHRSPGEDFSAQGSPLLEKIPRRAGKRFIPVSPMPRIDGGLELVTSDGDLATRLQRSMRSMPSEYSVRIHGELSEQGIATVLEGRLDTGDTLAIESCASAGGEGSNRWYTLAGRGLSGKDVRQLFERQGVLVSRVLRTRLASIALDRSLTRGRFRELEPQELEALLAAGSTVPPHSA